MGCSVTDAIRTEGLTRRYGRTFAVNDLTFGIEPGTTVGLLGPNGSGKSTLLKMITGLLRPTSGNVFVFGTDVHADQVTALADVGAVIETPAFGKQYTPRQILTCVADLYGMSRKSASASVNRVLTEVNMINWIDAKIGGFSKGMMQRIGLAQALISDPGLIILDEPTSGLDPGGAEDFINLLSKITEEKKTTLLISSHNLSEIEGLCERIVVLNKGKIIADGTTEEIKHRSGRKIVIEIRKRISEQTAEAIMKIPGVESVIAEEHFLEILFEGSEDDRFGIIPRLAELGVEVGSVYDREDSLKAAYSEILKETK